MKKCPHCAEEIQDEAFKCKHCKEWVARPPRRPIDVHEFIMVEADRANQIAAQFRPQIEEALRAKGFRHVRLTGDSLMYVWRLEMTKPQPPAINEIERILTGIVSQLRHNHERFEVKDGIVVTVVHEQHIKSAFFVWPRGTIAQRGI